MAVHDIQLCEASDENVLWNPATSPSVPHRRVTSPIEFVGGRAPNWFLALLYFAWKYCTVDIAWVVRYATSFQVVIINTRRFQLQRMPMVRSDRYS
jgi:hypothetical protein